MSLGPVQPQCKSCRFPLVSNMGSRRGETAEKLKQFLPYSFRSEYLISFKPGDGLQ
jgi:hypothetical protein